MMAERCVRAVRVLVRVGPRVEDAGRGAGNGIGCGDLGPDQQQHDPTNAADQVRLHVK